MRMFNRFRKQDIVGMMRSALTKRIPNALKTLRKSIKSTINLANIGTAILFASYFLIFQALFFSDHGFLGLSLSMPLFIGFTQATLDSFSHSENSEKSTDKKDVTEAPRNIDLKKNKQVLGFLYPSVSDIEFLENGKNGKGAAAYIRVSTYKQATEGDSLEAQESQAREIAIKIGTPRIFWVKDPGKSVKDFNSKKLNIILDLACSGKIDKLIIRDIDRVGRKSLKMLGFLIQLRGNGVTIFTPSGELDLEKLSDLIVTACKTFAAEEENLKRAHSSMQSKILAFKNRHWNLPIPKGYTKSGDWIKKNPSWQPIIEDIYNVFLRVKNFLCVTKYINEKYRNLLNELNEKPLSRHQTSRITQNTVYEGRPTCSAEATEKAFGSIVVDDPELEFVSHDQFEKAGQIVAAKRDKYSRKKKDLAELVENCGVEILEFLPNVGVLCPLCNGVMENNGGSNYLCKRCNKQLMVPKKNEMERIREWAFKRDKSLKTIFRVLGKYHDVKLGDFDLDFGELEKYL
jgi:DNA invertase Pin-like site-specific DNA recombinase